MHPSQIDALVQRLVKNPHDQDALAFAHQSGATDPKSYALLLERVGTETRDPAYASHWLSEAANVWSTTVGDAHRAARVLMQAIERDPTQRTAADRLAQLYRDKGDVKALVALLERRARALAPLAAQNPEYRQELAGMHEELGCLWNESLQQPKKALENFRRAMDLDPTSPYPFYGAREIYKTLKQWEDAYRMYDAELALESDPQRKVALLRDEAATRLAANDLPGASRAMGQALDVDGQDAALRQEFGSLLVERIAAGEDLPEGERRRGADALAGLAEVYDGEHGLAYSAGALDISPGHDRALQLYAHYASALGRTEDLSARYLAYVQANPSGAKADEARWLLAASYEGIGQSDSTVPATSAVEPPTSEAGTAAEPAPAQAAQNHPRREPPASLDAAQEAAAKGNEATADAKRLLDDALRWDDLANLLEQEASVEPDLEKKITLEKRIAALHEDKRKDAAGAAEAWSRIAILRPEDHEAISTAVGLFETAGALDRAAQVVSETALARSDAKTRGALLEKLGELRVKLGDVRAAGEAYQAAAEATRTGAMWDAAEQCYVAAQIWDRAANAAVRRAEEEPEGPGRAKHLARASEHYAKAGDGAPALANLERAFELVPGDEVYARKLAEHYTAAGRWKELAYVLAHRAENVPGPARVEARRQLARLYAKELGDKGAARDAWGRLLEDGEDKEALERLLDDAIEQTDAAEATAFLRRLEAIATEPADRVRLALREAEMLADEVGDVATAIARYQRILAELDPACRPALQAIADLEEAADNLPAATVALERELALVQGTDEPEQKGPIAARLARLYEQLGETGKAISSLEIARKANPEDFDTLNQLSELCEKDEDWGKVAELLAERIEVEADEVEVAVLTKRLSSVLADKLDRGDEALAVLAELADQGDAGIREHYIEVGDRLGWSGVVGEKLVAWWLPAKPSEARTANLRGAFDRFLRVGRSADAMKVAGDLAKIKGGADRELAQQLEELAVGSRDLDALFVAHDLLARDLAGLDRAEELVRQAEVRAAAGAPPLEALQHGETGLASVSPSDAERLLARLAAIAPGPSETVGLYERQVSRCKAPADRMAALARAAQIAAQQGLADKASSSFELAIAGTPTEDTLASLTRAAREGDERTGGEGLRRALAHAMAGGGQGARDGGRTRGALLRRSAVASAELGDHDQAFVWLGDALVSHVEPATLDALEELASALGEPQRAVATLGRALGEVSDGPLVRQLLARRARLRRDELDDKPGAAADLKKLHELSPSDQAVNEELSALLKELGDHLGIVQLYEDQILRGKEMSARADLARQVARMWEEELGDPREAADAWRRVLRMKQGDPEATAGLERAKASMLRNVSGGGLDRDTAPGADTPQAEPVPAAATAAPVKPVG